MEVHVVFSVIHDNPVVQFNILMVDINDCTSKPTSLRRDNLLSELFCIGEFLVIPTSFHTYNYLRTFVSFDLTVSSTPPHMIQLFRS